MLEALKTIDDAKEKEKLISSIRSLICGRSTDGTVCCDNANGEYLIFFISKLTLYLKVFIILFHLDFSRHSVNSNTNLTVPCGVGPVSRGHALGFRFVSDGSDAKILDVSTYLI